MSSLAKLTFAGRLFAGTPEAPRWGPPEMQVKTVKYWGLIGEGELRGQRGGRDIFVPCVVHGGYKSYASFDAVLKAADALVGAHGQLQITNSAVGFIFTRPNCSFRGFAIDQDPFAGPGYSPSGPIDGWWCRGVLHFRQLKDTG